MAEQITTHVADALARLMEQHRDKVKLAAFIEGVVQQVQDAEDAWYALLTERTVDTAVGTQLDALGDLVGQPREGLDDDTYRRYIRARISTNASDGLVSDVLKVLRAVINDPDAELEITPDYPAAFVARVNGVAVAVDVGAVAAAFLHDTAAAGVRAVFEYSPAAPAGTFTFDVGTPGTELDAGQFGDAI